MALALEEARRGVGFTSPNPPVGAVVAAGGEVAGRGFHRSAGEPHAEVEAMRQAGPDRCRGATLYVTLEPCSSEGRTPPCCEAVAAAGVARVVFGSTDPDPRHRGAAVRMLESRGVSVTGGVREAECDALVEAFAKRVTTGLPWVVVKVGQSLDGRITRPPGEGRWLTGQPARDDALMLRGQCDAVVVGAGTVWADDPSLTLRGAAAGRFAGKPQPWRVVMAGERELPAGARLFTDEHRERTLVYRGQSPVEVLRDLAANRGCNSVLVEGGGTLLGAFFAAGVVDALVAYFAPLWCGGGTVPASGPLGLAASVRFGKLEAREVGDCLRVEARAGRGGEG
jgi:diaminohydroxyphosphoribosylaminopyrimidine deaminase/5-amino-6-(5-phosphoribosylamino)uracil reductase